MKEDIRWKQRFSNYQKALAQLEKFIVRGKTLSDLEKQGYQDLSGSRDTFREAFKTELISESHRTHSQNTACASQRT